MPSTGCGDFQGQNVFFDNTDNTLDYVKISTVDKIDNKVCCMYQTTVKWGALQSLSDNLSSLTEWTTIFAIFDMCLISYFLTSTSSFNSLSLAFSLISHAEMWMYGSLIARHFPRTSFLHAVLLILFLFSQSRLECLEVKNSYQMFLSLF